jgi:HAD superfamily hydrolase (TIGR01509 family)
MARQVKAVIFDLYGVLALNGWQAFKAKHFTNRTDVWDQIFELGRKVDAGLADYDELITFTAKQAGESQETVRYQLEHTSANDELLDYIKTDLKRWYSIGILSNASRSEIVSQIFSPEQEDLFTEIILSHHVGLIKPDVRMYEAIAGKLGVQTEDCVFVDDQERHVAGAQNAGMQGLVYHDTASLKAELNTLLANTK